MSREAGRRVLHGIGIPVLAAVFIVAMLWAMSRILLAVPVEIAPVVALLFAANILVASALAVILRGRRAFVTVTMVLLAMFAAGGIAGALAGQRPIPSHVAGGETPHGDETPPPTGTPTAAPTETPTDGPTETPTDGGGAVQVVAEGTAFDTSEISLPPAPSTITFENRDPIPHNISIYTEQGGEALFQGELVTGETIEYQVPALEPGSYYFQCDVHPEMNGTVTVG
jgi:plastocyanin